MKGKMEKPTKELSVVVKKKYLARKRDTAANFQRKPHSAPRARARAALAITTTRLDRLLVPVLRSLLLFQRPAKCSRLENAKKDRAQLKVLT